MATRSFWFVFLLAGELPTLYRQYSKLSKDWQCPTCGAAKSFFVIKRMEIAGFAENQSFGLGTNALTGGQKALLGS